MISSVHKNVLFWISAEAFARRFMKARQKHRRSPPGARHEGCLEAQRVQKDLVNAFEARYMTRAKIWISLAANRKHWLPIASMRLIAQSMR
jgi:hypothetical protein